MQICSRQRRSVPKSVPKRILHSIYFGIISPFGRIFERKLVASYNQPSWPPIFIVGCPRSGTTVVYQSLIQSFRVSYFSNLMAIFFDFPATIAGFSSRLGGFTPPPSFNSVLGSTKGWRSPNQGNRIWCRWFHREGGRTVVPEWTNKTRQEIAGTIATIESTSGLPFINKWPALSTLIPRLVETFPTAVFICVRRDPLQTAQSILKARLDSTGDPNKPISRDSSCHSNFKHENYIDHVCSRVFGYNRDIDTSQQALGSERFFDVSYEEFCSKPRIVVEEVRQWYKNKTGYELQPRRTIPDHFNCSVGQKVSDGDLAALEKCIAEFEASNSSLG